MLPREPMRPVPHRAHDNNGKPFGKYPVWVGNISETMTDDELETLFRDFHFVSVSVTQMHKCAFVNFDDWDECQRSISVMNGREYAGKKLAVRLRNERPRASPNARREGDKGGTTDQRTPPATRPVEKGKAPSKPALPRPEKAKVRYFIMKSQSDHDLDISIEKGVWVTQSHNEAVLNLAYETCENVYLFFSITKSGEFYGLARMASPSGNGENFDSFADSSASSKESSPPVDAGSHHHKDLAPNTPISSEEKESQAATLISSPSRSPYSSPPPVSRVARITRDSVPSDFGLTNHLNANGRAQDNWGKPFAIQWLSLKKVPFQLTSHLINTWNEGNPVKISRDGTEIEPNVGHALQSFFVEDGQASLGDAATGSATSPISPPFVRIPYPPLQRYQLPFPQVGYQVPQYYPGAYVVAPQGYVYQGNGQGAYQPPPYTYPGRSSYPYYPNRLYGPIYYQVPNWVPNGTATPVMPAASAVPPQTNGGTWNQTTPPAEEGVEGLSESVGNMAL